MKKSPLTITLIFFVIVFIFMTFISYLNYKDHISFCEKERQQLTDYLKIHPPEFDSAGNFIYDPIYASDLSFYNGICLESDGAAPKAYTIFGLITLIFIFLAILSLKVDNLKKTH